MSPDLAESVTVFAAVLAGSTAPKAKLDWYADGRHPSARYIKWVVS